MPSEKIIVTCNNCGTSYHEAYSSNQANHCATEVIIHDNQKIAYGQYGSKYDTQRLLCSESNDIKLGLICDDCITKAIEKGSIKIDPDYVWVF